MSSAASARRATTTVTVGDVSIGSDHPIVVQSMTNTDTADVEATTTQVEALWRAGSEIVRITVNTSAAAEAVPHIAKLLESRGVNVPLVGDFHFNGHLLLPGHPDCAQALSKYRINPGNVGKKRWDDHFATIVGCAIEHRKAVRIGVNWGSLDQVLLTQLMDANAERDDPLDAHAVMLDAIVESAIRSATIAQEIGLGADQIVLSAKVSRVPDLARVYRELASRCEYPLHLGLTEAGMGRKGTVASASALAIVLAEGIGDTIRVSLTPEPGADRAEEVRVAQQILQSLELRSFKPQVTACPGCGRTTSTYFQELAMDVESHIADRLAQWTDRYAGVEDLSVAVMGCVVNGPGESKHSDIGISLPGTFEDPSAPVYIDGEHHVTLRGENIVTEFLELLDTYVDGRFGSPAP